ncbi:MAG: AraC family transcriptional regulator [Alistipes sp.]|nr:AraC family transcriptional regulator [Alistipes sp.]
MIDERLFYFIHGLVTMWFLMAGWRRFSHHESSRLEGLCGVILLYWGFLELKDLFFYATPIIRNNYISNILILVDMTAIPAGFCFVLELLDSGWCTIRRVLWTLAPYIGAIMLYAIVGSEWIYHSVFIYSVIYGLCTLIYIYFSIKRYNKVLSENYSNIESLQVNWLWEVVVMLVIAFIVWTVSCYFSSWIVDSCYQLLLLSMWMLVIYHADRQQVPTIAAAPPLRLPLDGVLSEALVAKLEHLLAEEKIWENPHLTLSDLAVAVGTNRTYLSNYLNNTLNTTFYDYINGFRLEAALEKLDDPASKATMVEIAESCGFNSISTFRRVFVRVKGCSLTEYRQRVLADDK